MENDSGADFMPLITVSMITEVWDQHRGGSWEQQSRSSWQTPFCPLIFQHL